MSASTNRPMPFVSDDSLLLGQNATETVLKAEDLTRFQTLAFATHGLLAGEISGLQEAGLIMTPPAAATAIDDGYLSASDIAALNLNTDVVLLSACNTAAPEQVGAEDCRDLRRRFSSREPVTLSSRIGRSTPRPRRRLPPKCSKTEPRPRTNRMHRLLAMRCAT